MAFADREEVTVQILLSEMWVGGSQPGRRRSVRMVDIVGVEEVPEDVREIRMGEESGISLV
jgi:hypothetical protein